MDVAAQTEHKQMQYITGVKVYFHTDTRPFVIPHSHTFRGAIIRLAATEVSFMVKETDISSYLHFLAFIYILR